MAPPAKSKKRDVVGQGVKEWTKGETVKLITLIQSQLPDRDELPYSSRIKILNWKQIKLEGKTVKDCEKRLEFLIKKIHRIRTLAEMLLDVDLEVVDMTKSKTSFALFCEDMKKDYVAVKGKHYFKVASEKYKKLTEEQKEYYKDESKRLSVDCKQEYSNETAKSSLTPLKLFVKHNENKETTEDQLQQQYKTLDDIEKLFWIRKSITAHEEVDIKTILTDDEYSLFNAGSKQLMNFYKIEFPSEVGPKATAQTDLNSYASEVTAMKNNQNNLKEELTCKTSTSVLVDYSQTTSFAHGTQKISCDSLKGNGTERKSDGIMDSVMQNTTNQIEPAEPEVNMAMSTSSENQDKRLGLKRKGDSVDFVNKRILLDIERVENVSVPLNNVSIIAKYNSPKEEIEVADQQEMKPTVIENQPISNDNLRSMDENGIQTIETAAIDPLRKEKPNDCNNKRIKLEIDPHPRFRPYYGCWNNFYGVINRIGNFLYNRNK